MFHTACYTDRNSQASLLASYATMPGCQQLLGLNGTHDAPPVRASYAVMDHVAALAAGKSFVEIGSRHGDLIDCVSHVTNSAVTIEADRTYCPTLRARAATSSGRFSSVCAFFSTTLHPMPAADLYFTWVQQVAWSLPRAPAYLASRPPPLPFACHAIPSAAV